MACIASGVVLALKNRALLFTPLNLGYTQSLTPAEDPIPEAIHIQSLDRQFWGPGHHAAR